MPKISELNEITSLYANDYFAVAHDLQGLPSTKKIKVGDLADTLQTYANYANNTSAGIIKVGDNLTVNSTGYMSASGGGGGNGYTGSQGSTGYTGSIGVGYVGSIGTAGYTGSHGDAGYTGSRGAIGYTGSFGPTGGSFGQILVSSGNGSSSWMYNPGVDQLIIENYTTTYTASNTDNYIFCDPNDPGSITVTLPTSAPQGKEYNIKNLTGTPGVKYVTVTTDQPSQRYLENPETGQFVQSYIIANRGDMQSWIHDGDVYRHIGSQTGVPSFITSANSYAQVVIKNSNNGINASSDLVIYSDTADYSVGNGPFIDVGIDSSRYSNSLYSIFGPNDAYVYTGNASLLVGTSTPNSQIKLFTGATDNSSNMWVFDEYGTLVLPTHDPSASPAIASVHTGNNMLLSVGTNNYIFGANGTITLPSGGQIFPGYPTVGFIPGVFSLISDQVYLVDHQSNNYIGVAGENVSLGSSNYDWTFNNGVMVAPYQPSNARTGSGHTVKLGDNSQQLIITGKETNSGSPVAQRLVIAGADGTDSGEGGDIYLWAGRSGFSGGTGGDIKVDAGDGINSEGGTIKIRAGNSDTTTGGFVEIRSGSGSTGAPIDMYTYNGSNWNNWRLNVDGALIYPDSTYQYTAFNANTQYTWTNNQTFLSPVTFSNNVIINGTISVNGNTEYFTSNNIVYSDALVEIHAPAGNVAGSWITNDGNDIGFRFHYYNGSDKNAGLFMDNGTWRLKWVIDGTESDGQFTNTSYGDFQANTIYNVGSVSGNSTVNTSISYGSIFINDNNTGSANLTIGYGVQNTYINSTALYIGTSTANATLTQKSLFIGDNVAGLTVNATSVTSTNNLILNASNITFSGNATMNSLTVGIGGTSILKLGASEEGFTTYNSVTGYYTVDCANGNIFNITPSGNFTPKFNNFVCDNNFATAITLLINQGGTAYAPTSNVNFGGSNVAVSWQGTTAPTGNINKKDIVTYSILNVSGTYTVLGQLVSFG